MATAKSSSGEVVAVQHDDGSVSIGVKRGSLFVPFVTQDAARFAQLVENAETLAERGASGPADEEGGS